MRTPTQSLLSDDPLWYKDAIIYELHVRSFCDGDADGIGDFPGLISKLDYLADLGVTALWLLPFYPSPGRDDGYDIADYMDVNPSYGTLADFKRFLKEAHRRGMRVITELVINHTSNEHPWFQRARRAKPGSKHREFYVWNDSPEKYGDARIIFQDFETSNWAWDPLAEAYYWHRFYSHQPDLNFDNPAVQRALTKVVDFWLKLGVDGMRLDAVPYLFERDGTNCENLPETHVYLKQLRAYIDANYPNRMLLAEANQWPEDAAAYFGAGDECHMNFHFPLMPRMYIALQLEDRFSIVDILEQTPPIPDNCQWALFLRNHDELTLEMVTDEDRDSMYRFYATDPQARINLGIRRRLAPLMQVRRKVELMNALLLSLPGTPVLYYGDELGMGDNIYLGDRNGMRTPMQWSGDRNAGFSSANPQRLFLPPVIDPEHHYEAVNVEAQQQNPSSLLRWMKQLIDLRKQHQAFSRGDVTFLHPDNTKVLCFLRRHRGERLLVVANLSRFAQYVELDLSEHQGATPIELFGRTRFPPIGELPYLLTLGPHAFYWFSLEEPRPEGTAGAPREVPTLEARGAWVNLFDRRRRGLVEGALTSYLTDKRWFRGKARERTGAKLDDVIPLETADGPVFLALVRVSYVEGEDETYLVPLAYATGARAEELREGSTAHLVAALRLTSEKGGELQEGVLYEPMYEAAFADALLALMSRRKAIKGQQGELRAEGARTLRRRCDEAGDELVARVSGSEQSNTSIVYGHHLILKLFRLVEPGLNPDLELGHFLSVRRGFEHTPPVWGNLSYRSNGNGKGAATLAVLQGFVPNQGDAWQFTLDALDDYFERALSVAEDQLEALNDQHLPEDVAALLTKTLAGELLGPFLPLVQLLGQRTAELHLALSSVPDESDFAPEPFSTLHQRSRYQAARAQTKQIFNLLRKQLDRVPERARPLAEDVLARQRELDAQLKRILDKKIETVRTRTHGDYHLGQVLYTGSDVVIIDFEGEPARPIGERRLKRSPLRDVACMLRSFHYASESALRKGRVRPVDRALLARWAERWHKWISALFMEAYLINAGDAIFIPAEAEEREILLDFFLMEKCVYELGYELNNRPDWVEIPLRGLLSLLPRL